MKTLAEKRDALLRRREELLAEWARNRAALLKRPKERTEEDETNPGKRITVILGELDAELDRLDRLIAEEAQRAAKEERALPAEEPPQKPAEEPPEEPLPQLLPALQGRLDSVLQRLEACYPDHTVRRLVQEHRQLSEDLTAVCKQLGYATREDFLNAYGYRIGAGRRNQRPPVRAAAVPGGIVKPEPEPEPKPRPEPKPEPEPRPEPEPKPEPEPEPERTEAAPQEKAAEPSRLQIPSYLQGRLDSVLQRLETYYPGRIISSGIDQAHQALGRDLTDISRLLGYASREGFLAAYGYQSLLAERKITESSGDVVKRKTDNVLRRLEEYYPDHMIPGGLEKDHKSLSGDISEVYRLLGFENRKEFLNAYGYTYETPVGGRPAQNYQPMMDALTEKYRDRKKPETMGVLLFENPEYKGPLKSLFKRAQELLGMSLAQYLRSIGVMAEKRAPRGWGASSAAGREEPSPIAGLSGFAAADLREYYQGLNPKFYGTFDDAVQRLEGLVVRRSKGSPRGFFVEGVAQSAECRANMEIPQGIDFIGRSAFQNQTGLETVVLPESLTEIQPSAFEGCTGLRHVTLPAGLSMIGDRAFGGCAALEKVDFQGGCPWVSESAFQGSGYRYALPESPENSNGQDFAWTRTTGGVSITGYTGSAEKLVIPGTICGFPVRGIAVAAFKGCRSLTEVAMPDTIRMIQRGAFADCANLQKIHLSNGVSRLFAASFSGCAALREVNIPDQVTVLPEKLFKDAPLERVHIGRGLETLDTDSFGSRSGGLAEITVDRENRHFKAEGPCLYSADGRVLYAFLGEGFLRVPEGVEQIGPGAFRGRKGLTEVVFPSTLTEIGPGAFRNSSLRRVEFGGAVRTIGDSAFENCGQLSSALFSQGLEKIGDRAFWGCPVRLVALPSSLRQLGEDCFDSLSDRRADTSQELRIAPGGPWEADGDRLYQVSGERKTLIRVYGPRFSAGCFNGYEKTGCTVAEGTTAIAPGVFENCQGLRSVTLPDSLREIGDRAFFGCGGLRGVRLPQGLRSIGAEAFRGTSVRSVTIPPELETIGTGAFAAGEDQSPSLRKVRVLDGNPWFQARENALLRRKEDGSWLMVCAFGKDETAAVPEGVTEIGRLAFYRGAVKEVRLPASVREVAMDAFGGCEKLTRLRLECPESGTGQAVVYFPALQGCYQNRMRQQYLDCIRTSRDGVFDFLTYDSLFPSIQAFKDKVLVATDRLKSAVHLAPLYRDDYLSWLQKNAPEAVKIVIEFDDLAGLNTLAELGVFTGENIDASIELANSTRKPEILSYLMNYKNAEIGIAETDYEL